VRGACLRRRDARSLRFDFVRARCCGPTSTAVTGTQRATRLRRRLQRRWCGISSSGKSTRSARGYHRGYRRRAHDCPCTRCRSRFPYGLEGYLYRHRTLRGHIAAGHSFLIAGNGATPASSPAGAIAARDDASLSTRVRPSSGNGLYRSQRLVIQLDVYVYHRLSADLHRHVPHQHDSICRTVRPYWIWHWPEPHSTVGWCNGGWESSSFFSAESLQRPAVRQHSSSSRSCDPCRYGAFCRSSRLRPHRSEWWRRAPRVARLSRSER
jgi:hypothetical protein